MPSSIIPAMYMPCMVIMMYNITIIIIIFMPIDKSSSQSIERIKWTNIEHQIKDTVSYEEWYEGPYNLKE